MRPPVRSRARDALEHAAQALGFDVVGVTTVDPGPRDVRALDAWLEAGYDASLAYVRDSVLLRRDGASLLPGARTLVTVAVNHFAQAPAFEAEGRYGRVARYAWGLDYHKVVAPRLERLAAALEGALGRPVRARVVVDAAPLLERAAAARAGTGFVGRNTMLILPRRGSWHLLGELLLDVELEPDPPAPAPTCGTCRRCLPACPTDAFPSPYVLDARRCISYWTIEHEGPIPEPMRTSMGAWVFGCDVCQDVCPFNGFARPTTWPEFLPQAGVGPRLDLEATLALGDDETFRARFGTSPLRYAGRASVLRNAAIVAGNVLAAGCVPALARRAREDAEPVVRGHALAALARLDAPRARREAERARPIDGDAFVRAEVEAVLGGA